MIIATITFGGARLFLNNNKIFIDWIGSVGVLLAAIFAYLSARASSLVGRMPYVPILTILTPKVYSAEEKSFFSVVNNSESLNAFAKSVYLTILGKDYFFGDIKPGFDNRINFDEKVDITGQRGEIKYKDIFGRKYKIKFQFDFIVYKSSIIEDRATNVDVVLNYKKLHI
jgi:hypothetical protein